VNNPEIDAVRVEFVGRRVGAWLPGDAAQCRVLPTNSNEAIERRE
jgi:hypothetical protein